MRHFITDGHIALRKYRLGDAQAVFEGIHESIKELTPWGFFHPGFTLEDTEDDVLSRISNWDEGHSFNFLIEVPPGAKFAGNCAIEELELDRNHAALGWWVRTSMTGRGIATAAGHLAALAALEDLKLTSLSIYTNAENIASRRVAEKLCATLVEVRPEENGVYCAVYVLKPEDLLGGGL